MADTYGWDIVYSSRFLTINKELQHQLMEEQNRYLVLREKIASAIAGGFNGRIKGVLGQRGGKYTLPPNIKVLSYEQSAIFEIDDKTGKLLGVELPAASVLRDGVQLPSITVSSPTSGSTALVVAKHNLFAVTISVPLTYDKSLPYQKVTITDGTSTTYGRTIIVGEKIVGVQLLEMNRHFNSKPTVKFENGVTIGTAQIAVYTKIDIVITESGSGYSKTNQPTLSFGSSLNLNSKLGIADFKITGGASMPRPSIVISAPTTGTQATAVAKYGVMGIVVTGSSGYTATDPPKVSVSDGTNSSKCTCTIIGSGRLGTITLDAPNVRFDSIPTLSIESKVGATPPTSQTISCILLAEITNAGSGYNLATPPVITMTPGSYTVTNISYGLGDIELSTGSILNTMPPVLEVEKNAADTATASGATAYATMSFNNMPAFSGASNTLKLMDILKRGIGTTVEFLYQSSGWDSIALGNVKAEINTFLDGYRPNESTTSILVFFESIIENIQQILWNKTHLYKSSEVVLLLKAQGKFNNYLSEPYLKDAEYVARQVFSTFKVDKNGQPLNWSESLVENLNKAIDTLLWNECQIAGERAKKAARGIQAAIVFDYDQLPNDPKYIKNIANITLNSNQIEQVYETVMEVLCALNPENYSHFLSGTGYDKSKPSAPLQKIRLNTGAWHFTPGGSNEIVYFKVPIDAGWLHFGNYIRLIEPRHQLYVLVSLNLNWARSHSKAHLEIPKDKSVNVLDILQEDDAPLINNFGLMEKAYLKEFIGSSFNSKATSYSADHLFPEPIDNAYSYNHTLVSINIFDQLAVSEPYFAWIYPTTVAYAVADGIDGILEDSILSICCMTEGRKNAAGGKADVNHVPNGQESAILISPEILTTKILLPSIAQLFNKRETKDSQLVEVDLSPTDFQMDGKVGFKLKDKTTRSDDTYYTNFPMTNDGDAASGNGKKGELKKESDIRVVVERNKVVFHIENAFIDKFQDNLSANLTKTVELNFAYHENDASGDAKWGTYVMGGAQNLTPIYNPTLPPTLKEFIVLFAEVVLVGIGVCFVSWRSKKGLTKLNDINYWDREPQPRARRNQIMDGLEHQIQGAELQDLNPQVQEINPFRIENTTKYRGAIEQVIAVGGVEPFVITEGGGRFSRIRSIRVDRIGRVEAGGIQSDGIICTIEYRGRGRNGAIQTRGEVPFRFVDTPTQTGYTGDLIPAGEIDFLSETEVRNMMRDISKGVNRKLKEYHTGVYQGSLKKNKKRLAIFGSIIGILGPVFTIAWNEISSRQEENLKAGADANVSDLKVFLNRMLQKVSFPYDRHLEIASLELDNALQIGLTAKSKYRGSITKAMPKVLSGSFYVDDTRQLYVKKVSEQGIELFLGKPAIIPVGAIPEDDTPIVVGRPIQIEQGESYLLSKELFNISDADSHDKYLLFIQQKAGGGVVDYELDIKSLYVDDMLSIQSRGHQNY